MDNKHSQIDKTLVNMAALTKRFASDRLNEKIDAAMKIARVSAKSIAEAEGVAEEIALLIIGFEILTKANEITKAKKAAEKAQTEKEGG